MNASVCRHFSSCSSFSVFCYCIKACDSTARDKELEEGIDRSSTEHLRLPVCRKTHTHVSRVFSHLILPLEAKARRSTVEGLIWTILEIRRYVPHYAANFPHFCVNQMSNLAPFSVTSNWQSIAVHSPSITYVGNVKAQAISKLFLGVECRL